MIGTDFRPEHFLWSVQDGVATITFDRPKKKNPLTFKSYAELRDIFQRLSDVDDIKSVVVTGAGENFCSGGDVEKIIGPLVAMDARELRDFTEMTGDLIIAMLSCPQVIVAAVDGVCVGAGAAIAQAADLRFGTERSRVAFLFVKVGLAGCDMGSCVMLPRIIGQGRAAELLYTGRSMSGKQAFEWGFYNHVSKPESLQSDAMIFARRMASGPTVAHATTKRMLAAEWNMGLIEAVKAEAAAQAECMQTQDFKRAYEAFMKKTAPKFEGD